MTNPSPTRSALTSLLGDSLLSICGLLGFALSFLSLYPLEPLPNILGPAPLLLICFALVGTMVWSLPRSGPWLAGGLTAGLACIVWLTWGLFSQGALLVFQSVVNLIAQRLGWVSHITYTPTAGLDQATSIEWFLLLSLALLALALGWMVVRARCWWLVVSITLPPLLPGLLADIYPNWLPFMVLTACWCTMLITTLCRWTAAHRRGPLTLISLPLVAALLSLLTVLLPMNGYSRPAWAIHAQEVMSGWLPALADWDGSLVLSSSYTGTGSEVDLTQAGPLRFTGQTVLKVTSSDYTGPLLLRGNSLAVYTGQTWKSLPQDIYQQEYLKPLTQQEQTLDTSPLLFPGRMAQQSGRSSHTVTVEHIRISNLLLYLPYPPIAHGWTEGAPRAVGDSHFLRQTGVRRYTISFPDLPTNHIAPLSSQRLQDMEEQYRSFVYRNYLDVPSQQRRIIQEWCADLPLPFSAPDIQDLRTLSEGIRSLLAQRCVYDPDTPLTPNGEDFVGYFLTQGRRGYCMHFASAATLIFRTYGIPARYVTGFAASSRQGQTVNVPDSAAHAWVEVYLDGYGWYPVDVTPGYSYVALTSPDPTAGQPTSEIEASPSPESTVPSPSAVPSSTPASPQPSEWTVSSPAPGRSILRLLWWCGAAALLAAVLWLMQFLLKRHRMSRLHNPNPNQAVMDCYRYLTQLARWDGGQVDPEAQALAEKARFSQHAITPAERQTMAAMFQQERQRLATTLPSVRRSLFHYWWGAPRLL